MEGTACAKVQRQERTWNMWGMGSRLDWNPYLSEAQRVNGEEQVGGTQVYRRLESKTKAVIGRALEFMLRT